MENTEAKAKIEEVVGQPVQKASYDANTMQALKDGVLVDLTIGRWRAQVSLDFSELGLENQSDEFKAFAKKYLIAGRKNLLPKDLLDSMQKLESQMRVHLVSCSFPSPWKLAFVPCSAFAVWKKKHEELKAEYLAIGQSIYDTFDSLMAQVRTEYQTAALEAWKNAGNPGEPSQEWVDQFCDMVMANVPSREYIRESFRVQEVIYFVPTPDDLEETLAKADAIRQERGLSAEKIRQLHEMDLHMIKVVEDQKKEIITGFFADAQKKLRTLIFDHCTNVLDGLKGRDKLHGRSLYALRNMQEKISTLNCWEWADLTKQMDEINTQIGDKDAKDVDEAALKTVLYKIAEESRSVLLSLGEAPREIRHLVSDLNISNIPDTLGKREVREMQESPVVVTENLNRETRNL